MRISWKGNQLKYYTELKIKPAFWNGPAQRARKNFLGHPEFNRRVELIENTVLTTYRKFQNDSNNAIPTPAAFKDALNIMFGRQQGTAKFELMEYFENLIARSEARARVNPRTKEPIREITIKGYRQTLGHLEKFQNSKHTRLDFSSINLDFYHSFTEFLQTSGLKRNSIGSHIKNLKLVMNEAAADGLHTNIAHNNKRFAKFKVPTDSVFVTEDELKAMLEHNLDDRASLKDVRDLFIIASLTGIRYSDLAQLVGKNFSSDTVSIIQSKTGAAVIIPVHPMLRRLVNDRNGILPQPFTNQAMNRMLKDICKEIPEFQKKVSIKIEVSEGNAYKTFSKWELISMHCSRRSFASNNYLAGAPMLGIMSITGHKSTKSFIEYVKLGANDHAAMMREFWTKSENNLKAI